LAPPAKHRHFLFHFNRQPGSYIQCGVQHTEEGDASATARHPIRHSTPLAPPAKHRHFLFHFNRQPGSYIQCGVQHTEEGD
ncbi:hypothetical protein VS883_28205, partial [Escherichia coli]